MTPEITVIIPTYKRSDFLHLPLDSLSKQTFKDFEVIVVDEISSNDNSRDVVKKYQESDSRIRYIQKDMGNVSKALNTGIELSGGEYISLLDSDDSYYPTTLEDMLKVMKKRPDIALAYSDMIFERDGIFVKNCIKPEFNRDTLLSENYIGHVKVIRKDALLSIDGFNESMDLTEDYDMLLRLSEKYDFLHVNKILYKYNYHDQRITVLRHDEQRKAKADSIEWAKKRRGSL